MEHNELRFVLERKVRLQLQGLIADGNTRQKIVKRARIILMTADGHGVMAIMREVGISTWTGAGGGRHKWLRAPVPAEQYHLRWFFRSQSATMMTRA